MFRATVIGRLFPVLRTDVCRLEKLCYRDGDSTFNISHGVAIVKGETPTDSLNSTYQPLIVCERSSILFIKKLEFWNMHLSTSNKYSHRPVHMSV